MERRASSRTRMRDPWEVAQEAGIPVSWANLPEGIDGLWASRIGVILLDKRLTERYARCVLAHELSHALHGDRDDVSDLEHERHERRADREAAAMLIDPRHVERLRQSDLTMAQAAAELNVTEELLTVFVEEHLGDGAHRCGLDERTA